MTTITLPHGGYTATMDVTTGMLTVHRVPIFVECERNEIVFDRGWIEKAVVRAKQAESEGYLPPLHIRHHGEETGEVRPAGFFRVLGVEQLRFKGKARSAIMVDLVITDPAAQQEVLQMRLPYRSVEIFDVHSPNIDSLALLDHEAPFLELPMLAIRELHKAEQSGGEQCRIVESFALRRGEDGDTIAATFTRGKRASILFRDEETKMADDGKDDKDGEKMEAGPSVEAICKAIADGSISVADMSKIMEAITSAQGGGEAAPAETPDAQMARTDNSEALATLQGKYDALSAQLAEMQADAARKHEVAAALKRLADRPLGSDLEGRLTAFHREHGGKAFAAYVQSMETFAAPTGTRMAMDTAPIKMSKTVESFMKDGPDAVEKAAQFSNKWAQLKSAGLMRITEQEYVTKKMNGEI
jgi:hypothetical protein